MNLWIDIWQYILILGIGAFVLSVIVIVPLGARDIWTLLNRLGSDDRNPDSKSVSDNQPTS
jgi:hypothetical protein